MRAVSMAEKTSNWRWRCGRTNKCADGIQLMLIIEQFWDGRAATLRSNAGGPPLNPIEMTHKSRDEIASLDKDPVLKRFSGGLSASAI